MNEIIDYDAFKDIDIKTYDWSVRFIRSLTKKLKSEYAIACRAGGIAGRYFFI